MEGCGSLPIKKAQESKRKRYLKKNKIIIIDSYREAATTFACILKKNGYTADTAQTYKEAIEKTDIIHYAIAIIDAELSGSTHILLKLAKTKTIKIVITDFPEEAILNGADACLRKVIKPEEFLFLIKKMLK
jgi:DNA-binding response OmpR family regulator